MNIFKIFYIIFIGDKRMNPDYFMNIMLEKISKAELNLYSYEILKKTNVDKTYKNRL